MTYLLALLVGILVGMMLATLGGGGAIIAVPALVYLLGQQPHTATTSSLIIVIISASAGLIRYWRTDRVRVGAGVAFAVAGLIGSFLGSQLSSTADPDVLLLGFSALMLMVAALMMLRQRAGADAGSPPTFVKTPGPATATATATATRSIRQLTIIASTATGVGFLTGLFGVGGGIIVVPALVLALGFAMPTAVGTSLLVIILNSLAALAVRFGGHTIFDWPLIAVFTLSAVIGVLLGSSIVDHLDARRWTQAFIVLITIVASYTAARSLLHLA